MNVMHVMAQNPDGDMAWYEDYEEIFISLIKTFDDCESCMHSDHFRCIISLIMNDNSILVCIVSSVMSVCARSYSAGVIKIGEEMVAWRASRQSRHCGGRTA